MNPNRKAINNIRRGIKNIYLFWSTSNNLDPMFRIHLNANVNNIIRTKNSADACPDKVEKNENRPITKVSTNDITKGIKKDVIE